MNELVHKIAFDNRTLRCVSIGLDQNHEERIAFVVPGAGYSVDRPLLYYLVAVLIKKKIPLILLDEVPSHSNDWLTLGDDSKRTAWVVANLTKLVDFTLKRWSPSAVSFYGKSIGTYAIAEVLKQWNGPRINQVGWITPSLQSSWQIMESYSNSSFAVIGNKDPRYLEAESHLPQKKYVGQGADHSMDVESPLDSVNMMVEIVNKYFEWIF